MNTPYTINLVLDTTAAQWSTALYIDNTLVASSTDTSGNPIISSVGYGQTTTTAGAYKWNDFALTQEAPNGVQPYLLNPQPPTSVTFGAGSPLSIPATAFSSFAPYGYYWSNTNTTTVLESGTTNNVDPLAADLNVAAVPSSWNGNTLALVSTNAYGTNISLVSLTVTNAINLNPTNIVFSVTNNQLTLSGPTDHTGWTLQTQTNSAGAGLSTNWFDVASSSSTNQITFPIDSKNGSVFYRLNYQ